MGGELGRAVVGGQGFQQKAGDPLGQEQVGFPAVDLPPGQLSPLRGRADVGKYAGVIGRGAVPRNPAGGLYDPRGDLPLALGQLQPGGEGVGLDGAAPRLQVGPVDGGDLLRGGEAGQLATLDRKSVV